MNEIPQWRFNLKDGFDRNEDEFIPGDARIQKINTKTKETLEALGFSGPYFDIDRVAINTLARDVHYALIDENLVVESNPVHYNFIRETIVKAIAKALDRECLIRRTA